jgi:hypothetical protein
MTVIRRSGAPLLIPASNLQGNASPFNPLEPIFHGSLRAGPPPSC